MYWNSKLIISLLLILFASFLLPACKQPFQKDEAEKYLRAFDNELISLIKNFQHTRAFIILREILAIENVPVPFFAHKSEIPGGIQQFNFEKLKGVYDFDSINKQFILSGASDSIIINFNRKQSDDKQIKLVIAEYAEEATSSNLMFPTNLKASMFAGSKKIVEIEQVARLEHQLPLEAQLRIDFENYHLEVDLASRLRRNHANATFKVAVSRNSEKILCWLIKSKVGFTKEGSIFIRSLQTQMSVFPVFIRADIDNDAIKSNAIDFIDEFNRYSSINVFCLKDKRKLGDVRLKARESSDKLDYAFFYNDNSSVFLEDLLFTIEKLMNIKK